MTTQFERDVADHLRAADAQRMRNLGPGETPKREADIVEADGSRRAGRHLGTMSLEDAEMLGNPIIPIDPASGHKMHPADAYSGTIRPDHRVSQGFGGSGHGVAAGQRTLMHGEYVTEIVDPTTKELVRTLHAADGIVIDQQREPLNLSEPITASAAAAPARQGVTSASQQEQMTRDRVNRDQAHNDDQMRQRRAFQNDGNGPVL